MVTQLFLAVTEKAHTSSQKRNSDGTFVSEAPYAKAQRPKYSLEEWQTISHDAEFAEHPEKPIFKDEHAVFTEAEQFELRRLRRMERQPELGAQLDEIANWLYDLLTKKGKKEVSGIVLDQVASFFWIRFMISS